MDELKKVLSVLEQAALQNVAGDEVTMEAIRKVMLFGLYNNGTIQPGIQTDPMRNFAIRLVADPSRTDEQIGAFLRANAMGISLVESGFDEIRKFKVEESGDKENSNPAR